MRPLKAVISLSEAMRIVMDHASPIEETEEVGLLDAPGRVLARDVVSPVDVPDFTRAAMDGYAVRAADTFGAGDQAPKRLRRVETVHAGRLPTRSVGSGDCTEIATGAMLPGCADAVVPVEETEADGDEVRVHAPAHPGKNVTPAGEDIKKGEVAVAAGAVLSPARIGAAANVGLARLAVYRRPRVTVIATGDELAPVGTKAAPGQVYNCNSYTLAAVCRDHGAVPTVAPIAPDDKERLREALAAADDADLVVFSAGSSVGTRDMMADLLEEAGDVLFHGIAVKPGKPTLFAVLRDGRRVLGMPGYPTSCLSNAYMMMVPMLRSMGRLPAAGVKTVRAVLARRVVSTIGRHQFFTVTVRDGVAHPAFKTSGAITSMSRADGYIEIPDNVDIVEKGDEVTVILF